MPTIRYLALLSLACVASCSAPPVTQGNAPSPRAFSTSDIARGANLAALGNCVTCHTAPGGKPFAGGYALKTPFGTVHGTNITPDEATGIGHWNEADFRRALKEGLSPEGHHYYPAFPYAYFTHLTDDDVHALYAFVMTREAVHAQTPANSVIVPRFAVGIWNGRYFHPGPARSDPSRDAAWNRGVYLADSLAHCSECHTPRDKLQGEKAGEYLSGGDVDGWHAPALNQHSPSPVPWNIESLETYLASGLVDRHAIAAGPMRGVVDNLGRASRDDVHALAVYIASMERSAPAHSRAPEAVDPSAQRGQQVYAGACKDCHGRGRAADGGALPLEEAIALAIPTPSNLIHIVREGIVPRADRSQPVMPAFKGALTDEQLVDLLAYLRTIDGVEWKDLREQVRDADKEHG
jgi:nicotinate dehydrogenase subunit B